MRLRNTLIFQPPKMNSLRHDCLRDSPTFQNHILRGRTKELLSYIFGRPAKVIYALMALALIAIIAQANGSGSALPQSAATSGAGPQPMAPSGAIQGAAGGDKGSTSAPVDTSGTSHHPIVGREIKHDLSQPLRDMRPLPPPKAKQEAPENLR